MNRDYLLKEKPLKAILILALPMIAGNFFQQFYTMADSMIVGRLVGEEALAAIGASYALTTVFISIAIGGGVGSSVITSRAFGAGDFQKVKNSATTAIITFVLIGCILMEVGLLFAEEILLLLNTPLLILDEATTYLGIYFMGLPFLFLYNVLASIFNALGRSKVPLYLLIFSSSLNIILDIIMVGPLGMGVAGAAWATLISQGISALISLFVMTRLLSTYESADRGRFRSDLIASMAAIALPSILQQATISIGMMLVQSVVNSFGASMLAGYSAGMRIESIAVVPFSQLGNAMSSYAAQNIGAKQEERVSLGYRKAHLIVFSSAVVCCIILELFHDGLINLFLENGSAEALATGSSYLKFIGFFFVFIGLKMITDGLLRAYGKMKAFTSANILNLTFRVAFSFVMAPIYGISMVWVALPVGWIINYVVSFTALMYYKRKGTLLVK